MKGLLDVTSTGYFLVGLIYILIYTFVPQGIPDWLSFTFWPSMAILSTWAINLAYFLIALSRQ